MQPVMNRGLSSSSMSETDRNATEIQLQYFRIVSETNRCKRLQAVFNNAKLLYDIETDEDERNFYKTRMKIVNEEMHHPPLGNTARNSSSTFTTRGVVAAGNSIMGGNATGATTTTRQTEI